MMTDRIGRPQDGAEKLVRDIRRATRRTFSAEEKIRIVIEGLRGEDSVAELCRKEGFAQNVYYRCPKDFLEAGKKRLAGDTLRAAASDEVKELRAEARQLKDARGYSRKPVAEKKCDRRWGRRMRYAASEKLEITYRGRRYDEIVVTDWCYLERIPEKPELEEGVKHSARYWLGALSGARQSEERTATIGRPE